MMKILVLNGPNLNMLGKREPELYGSDTLESIEEKVESRFPDHAFTFRQSNEEGQLVGWVQSLVDGEYDALIANFGAYSHTSIALRDALAMVQVPKVEVHLTNIHAREDFRHTTHTGAASDGIISGFGVEGYLMGVQAAQSVHQQRD